MAQGKLRIGLHGAAEIIQAVLRVQHLHLVHRLFKEHMRLRRFGGDMHAVGAFMREGMQPKNPKTMTSASVETLIRFICNSLNNDQRKMTESAASSNARARQLWLVAFQKISLLQRKLAINFQNIHAAVNGVNVHQPNRAGNGFHRFQKLIFRPHNNYATGMCREQRLNSSTCMW